MTRLIWDKYTKLLSVILWVLTEESLSYAFYLVVFSLFPLYTRIFYSIFFLNVTQTFSIEVQIMFWWSPCSQHIWLSVGYATYKSYCTRNITLVLLSRFWGQFVSVWCQELQVKLHSWSLVIWKLIIVVVKTSVMDFWWTFPSLLWPLFLFSIAMYISKSINVCLYPVTTDALRGLHLKLIYGKDEPHVPFCYLMYTNSSIMILKTVLCKRNATVLLHVCTFAYLWVILTSNCVP